VGRCQNRKERVALASIKITLEPSVDYMLDDTRPCYSVQGYSRSDDSENARYGSGATHDMHNARSNTQPRSNEDPFY